MTAIYNSVFNRPKWQTVIISALAFWLSSSLILDLVVMPGMYAAGMMTQADFATAGYSIFWVFNRLEVLCAALVLTGVLVLNNIQSSEQNSQVKLYQGHHRTMVLSVLLLAVALIYTYGLTPEMSALGLHLDLFASTAEVPAAMDQMHQGYWLLEVFKLLAGGTLLGLYYKGS